MFTEPFMVRALLVALCLGPLCALLGVFATARGMAFFSDTIAHGALAGVALGFWLGWQDPTVPIVLVSILVAAAILWLKSRTQLATDTIMALLLSGSVAVGITILSLLKGGHRADIHRLLFGDILAVSSTDVWMGMVLLGLVGGLVFFHLSSLALLTAEEEMARVCGLPVGRLNYGFVLSLTLTVAVTIKLVGIILVTSLLVIPPASARNLCRNLRQEIIVSLAIGLIAAFLGVVSSYQWNIPCGPAIVLICLLCFVISLFRR